MTKGTEQDAIDWSPTTFDGVRREQLRRWARFPLEDAFHVRALRAGVEVLKV